MLNLNNSHEDFYKFDTSMYIIEQDGQILEENTVIEEWEVDVAFSFNFVIFEYPAIIKGTVLILTMPWAYYSVSVALSTCNVQTPICFSQICQIRKVEKLWTRFLTEVILLVLLSLITSSGPL